MEKTTSPALFMAVAEAKLLVMLVTVAMILPLALRIYVEYLAFLALGPGGTPATLPGFLRVKAIGLFALRDPYQPRKIHPSDRQGYLSFLPKRPGPRPAVRGIAPQRQMTQRAGKETFEQLSRSIEVLARSSNPPTFELRTSCFEKHSTGLFTLSPSPSISHTPHRCKAEVVHVHGTDGSMHLTLHPADARFVLEGGWGERHPLSRGGRFERFVPVDFVMVYAPREKGEVDVVMRIVRAAGWFVGGMKGEGERRMRGGVDGRGD